MKKILLVLAMVGLVGAAVMQTPSTAVASCSFTGVLAPNCAGPGNTCLQVWFGYTGTGTVDLQRKAGANWVTVASNITSGSINCGVAPGLGKFEYRLRLNCSNGAVTYSNLGSIACP